MDKIELKYNVPIEVNERQYRWVVLNCKGMLAHRRTKDKKYFIKTFCTFGNKSKIEAKLNQLK